MKTLLQNTASFLFLCLLFTHCKTPDTPATPKSSAKSPTSLTIEAVTGASSMFDATTSTYTVTVPSGTDVTALKVSFTLPTGATSKPVVGSVQNFTNPVIYTVTAEDGSTQIYTIKVIVASAPKSSEKQITGFVFAALSPIVSATIDQSSRVITATVPSSTDANSLVPTLLLSAKSTVSPASGMVQNFTNPVSYTVTAEDGSKQIYTVTIVVGATITISLKEGLAGGSNSILANGKSTIYFDVNVFDKNKNILSKDGLKYYAGDNEISNLSFSTTKEGDYNIYVKGYNTTSNIIKVTARKDEVFEVVRIPLVFHLMYKNDTWSKADLGKMIEYVNKVYAGTLYDDSSPKRDPNTVNTYIQFYLADSDPNGKKLEILGLNKVSEDPKIYGTSSDPDVVKNAISASWNPTKYLNIFLYNSQYPNAASGFFPKLPSNKTLKGVPTGISNNLKTSYGVYWPGDFRIDVNYYFSAFAHELGHCLALYHVFQDNDCSQDFDYCPDTPTFLFAEVNKGQVRSSCSQVKFLGTNVMDYSVPGLGSFTYDQRARMRHITDWAYDLPTKVNQNR